MTRHYKYSLVLQLILHICLLLLLYLNSYKTGHTSMTGCSCIHFREVDPDKSTVACSPSLTLGRNAQYDFDSRTISAEPLNIITQQAVGYDYCLVIGSHWIQNGFLFLCVWVIKMKGELLPACFAFSQRFQWVKMYFYTVCLDSLPLGTLDISKCPITIYKQTHSVWTQTFLGMLLVSSGRIHIKEL